MQAIFTNIILERVKKKYPQAHLSNSDGYEIFVPEADKRIEVRYDEESPKTGNIIVEKYFNKDSDFRYICNEKEVICISLQYLRGVMIWNGLKPVKHESGEEVYIVDRELILKCVNTVIFPLTELEISQLQKKI